MLLLLITRRRRMVRWPFRMKTGRRRKAEKGRLRNRYCLLSGDSGSKQEREGRQHMRLQLQLQLQRQRMLVKEAFHITRVMIHENKGAEVHLKCFLFFLFVSFVDLLIQFGIEFTFFVRFFLMGTAPIALKFKVQRITQVWAIFCLSRQRDDCISFGLKGASHVLHCTWKDNAKQLQGCLFSSEMDIFSLLSYLS